MYKCAKCGKVFDDLPDRVVRCPSCAYKVVFRVRDPIAKNVKAR